MTSRRAFLRFATRASAGTVLSIAGGTGYATRLEPEMLKRERLSLALPGLPAAFDGYRIAQLSDLHLSTQRSRLRLDRAVKMALKLEADLLVITGDFVTSTLREPSLREALQPLTANPPPDGVWASMGNHDHWVDAAGVRRVLAEVGISELHNSNAALERSGGRLWLAGVDDVWEQQHDLDAALSGIPAGETTILLAHEPDFADQSAATGRVALQLSGHSHGGQVRLPLLGAPVVPYLAEKYRFGLYTIAGMRLYVNRGVGNVGVMGLEAVRLNCRPEVTEITLLRG